MLVDSIRKHVMFAVGDYVMFTPSSVEDDLVIYAVVTDLTDYPDTYIISYTEDDGTETMMCARSEELQSTQKRKCEF